jgi:hypothetical protein
VRGVGSLDGDLARGSSEEGTETKAPKSESVELVVEVALRGGRESGRGENIERES